MNFRRYGQKWLFQRDLIKTSFFLKYRYFRIYGQKTTFPKWSQNNVCLLEILIFLGIWTKNYFFKGIKNTFLFDFDIFGDMGKKDFFRYIDKKRLFQSDLKLTSVSSKYWYFWAYEQKTIFLKGPKIPFASILIFSEIWAIRIFLDKHFFSGNVNIFGYIGKKRLFQSDLKTTLFSSKYWYFWT